MIRKSILRSLAFNFFQCQKSSGIKKLNMIQVRSLKMSAFEFSSTQQNSAFEFELKDEQQFDSLVLKNDKPVILDFHAEWCGPCKRLGPILSEQVQKAEGKWVLVKVDCDNFGELAQKYQVNGIPHVALINKGQVVDKFVGLPPAQKLSAFLDKINQL